MEIALADEVSEFELVFAGLAEPRFDLQQLRQGARVVSACESRVSSRPSDLHEFLRRGATFRQIVRLQFPAPPLDEDGLSKRQNRHREQQCS